MEELERKTSIESTWPPEPWPPEVEVRDRLERAQAPTGYSIDPKYVSPNPFPPEPPPDVPPGDPLYTGPLNGAHQAEQADHWRAYGTSFYNVESPAQVSAEPPLRPPGDRPDAGQPPASPG